ncbi:hypothetical protein CBR_g38178 [Chara braunii]|uniref:EVE domain-containing protein n=1 Tax=Chara braunii TaxID=69332 RepID=A0A388LPD2_CHABU|nr:hypothetical protein CBR_g38178 [Chara braunii]|eukprot:GBG84206.1 hypothetical protein CBR_g38178 [Chara braunii]
MVGTSAIACRGNQLLTRVVAVAVSKARDRSPLLSRSLSLQACHLGGGGGGGGGRGAKRAGGGRWGQVEGGLPVHASMSYWLLKTEPHEWSWSDQSAAGGRSTWDGVRNAQAQKNMKQMAVGDLCFFYHTGKERAVVGIAAVSKTWYPDPTDESRRSGMVQIEEVMPFQHVVTLAQIKGLDDVADFQLVRQPRLSVVPVPADVWKKICDLGGVEHVEAPWKSSAKPSVNDDGQTQS